MAFGASLLDNLSSPKSPKAAAAMRAVGAWFLFLPPYSPDLTPIEINRGLSRTHGVRPLMFAKLKARVRSAAARCADTLCSAIASALAAFTSEECARYLRHAGYASRNV